MRGSGAAHGRRPKLLRVVTQASRTGRYGGPFDTAVNQCRLLANESIDCTLFSGSLPGDAPDDVAGSAAPALTSRFVTAAYLFGYGSPTLFSLRVAAALYMDLDEPMSCS